MKELWFDEMERRIGELEDEGYSFTEAVELANSDEECDAAMMRVIDRLADHADHLRAIEKDRRYLEGLYNT